MTRSRADKRKYESRFAVGDRVRYNVTGQYYGMAGTVKELKKPTAIECGVITIPLVPVVLLDNGKTLIQHEKYFSKILENAE
ncbi:MAG: hypothetical protein E7188_02550 [Erysipelotrichaceae bacterium]|nr:hypothetical protein [Erysipelotrichaceae bacterium]